MDEYSMYVGLDLGDRTADVCVLDLGGEIEEVSQIRLERKALVRFFGGRERCAVALESGTHSRWVQDLLLELGHVAVVANARKVRAVFTNEYKSDRRDAEMLARLLRADARLLSPVVHRSRQAQADLAVIKTRDHLVRERSKAINYVRGTVKSYGNRLRSCSAESFHRRASEDIPGDLLPALQTMLDHIASLTQRIRELDRAIATIAKERYPETKRLMSVRGVGPLTALAFVLTVEDPNRFEKSRTVGAFFGLVPRRDQSGNRDPRLPISKCGDGYMRRLLVSAAQYILGPFGQDSALRDWGLQRAQGEGRGAKRAAVVGVARRLAVLLHRLWIDDTDFVPYPKKSKRQRVLATIT